MQILDHADLTACNTLGIAARAERLCVVASVDELREALELAGDRRVTVLGGGSNVVLSGDLDGLVLRMAIPGRTLIDETVDAWHIRAGAGENWHDFVRWTLDQGWPGLENLSLIPGTVGAAPIQNIGAYGVEQDGLFASLEALDRASGKVVTLDRAACRFAYRDSLFKREPERHVITAVTYRLPKAWRPHTRYRDVAEELAARGVSTPTAHDVSDAVIAIRTRKLPDWRVLGNAGSFFKNPLVDDAKLKKLLAAHPALPHYPQPGGGAKLAAGWLIEQAGWKGKSLGHAGCFEKQALVLVNRGGASGDEILALAAAVRTDVQIKFGVALEQEPVVL
jgi:UDP-N-acetylmuramate dehydrogenase